MKLAKGDMFQDVQADVVLVTTNAFIKNDGSLVMGRGAAAQLANMYPGIPGVFGSLIKEHKQGDYYGVIIDPTQRFTRLHPNRMYGAFQVKYEWYAKADIQLITKSSLQLRKLADLLPNWKFAMNFPGIGNGQLSRDEVFSWIESILPDNVEVWEF